MPPPAISIRSVVMMPSSDSLICDYTLKPGCLGRAAMRPSCRLLLRYPSHYSASVIFNVTGGASLAGRRSWPRIPGPAKAGPVRRGSRSSRPDLRLVHRGLRYARPEGGKSLVGRTCAMIAQMVAGNRMSSTLAQHGIIDATTRCTKGGGKLDG